MKVFVASISTESNTFAPAALTGLRLEVDGLPVPPERLTVQEGAVAAARVRIKNPYLSLVPYSAFNHLMMNALADGVTVVASTVAAAACLPINIGYSPRCFDDSFLKSGRARIFSNALM